MKSLAILCALWLGVTSVLAEATEALMGGAAPYIVFWGLMLSMPLFAVLIEEAR